MISKKVRSGAAVVVIGAALFATLGEASKESGSGSASNPAPNAQQTTVASAKSGDPASAPTETTAPASSAAAPIPLGTVTTVAAGWDVTVNSANLNADAILAAENQFATPSTGSHFVLVNVTVANKSDKPASTGSNVKMSMLPPSGVAIDSTFSCAGFAPEPFDTMAQMQPDAVATGNVCFEVKEVDIATSLLLGEPQFTMDEVEDQRFFAIQ